MCVLHASVAPDAATCWSGGSPARSPRPPGPYAAWGWRRRPGPGQAKTDAWLGAGLSWRAGRRDGVLAEC
jgi:hypothetical protein